MPQSPLQTWALMGGGRSGTAGRATQDTALLDWLSTLLNTPAAARPAALSEDEDGDQRTNSFPSSSSSSSSSSSGGYTPPAPSANTDFYTGGIGAPSWLAGLASPAIGALGQLGQMDPMVTGIGGKLANIALSQEGINGHTVGNGGFELGASMLGLGLPNMAIKLGAKLLGYEYDPANFVGELTNSPGLMSPRTLNLRAFERGSGDAFAGLNQPTLAEIDRQEARNAAEHAARNRVDAAAAEQDAQMQARAERAAATRASALNQLAAQERANRAAMSSSSAAPVNGSTSQSGGNTGRHGSAVGPGSGYINQPSGNQSNSSSSNSWSSSGGYSSDGSRSNGSGMSGGTGGSF